MLFALRKLSYDDSPLEADTIRMTSFYNSAVQSITKPGRRQRRAVP